MLPGYICMEKIILWSDCEPPLLLHWISDLFESAFLSAKTDEPCYFNGFQQIANTILPVNSESITARIMVIFWERNCLSSFIGLV